MFNWTIFFRREELSVDNIGAGNFDPSNIFLTWGDNIEEAIVDFEMTMCLTRERIVQIYVTERK